MATSLEKSHLEPHNPPCEHQQGQKQHEEEMSQPLVADVGGWRLALLLVAIMLGGFLVALVCEPST
jgi:hypothetical protein